MPIRRDNIDASTIAMQLLPLPDNYPCGIVLARLAKDIDLDYLVVKSYAQHPQRKTIVYNDTVVSRQLINSFPSPVKSIARAIRVGCDLKTFALDDCFYARYGSYADQLASHKLDKQVLSKR